MKYQVIAQNAQDYPIKLMCQTLEVSESGYYAWKRRPLSHRAQADQQIASHIQQAHQASHQISGSRRIQAELAEQGVACSRKRVVRLMQQAAHRNAELVELALNMAQVRRHPEVGLLHHLDRGSQYTSGSYQALLAQRGIQVSMSGKGDCYDNAAMESFFSSLKGEWTDWHTYRTRKAAQLSIFDYIEVFYNRQRRHSTLG